MMVHKVIEISRHRNGVMGEPFYVVLFERTDGKERMLGIVFDSPGRCAVLDVDALADNMIAFAINSWRGDLFEAELRKAIADFESLPRRAASNFFPHKQPGLVGGSQPEP